MITRRDFLKVTAASSALVSFGNVTEAKNKIQQFTQVPSFCEESERNIPIIEETDIVIIGGSSGAVSAAVSAAKTGSKVFLIAGMPYLGDDICGSFMYQIDKKEEQAQTAIARKIFLIEEDPRISYNNLPEKDILYTQQQAPTPLHVKTTLENELINNDIHFLYSSLPTNVLIDKNGNIAGVVIANRSGRQAIRCKGIIDTTTTAVTAEMCNVPFTEFKPGKQTFTYTVVGNKAIESPKISKVNTMPFTVKSDGKEYPVIRYTFDYEIKDKSYASLMEAEQYIRDITWDADQVDSSDLLWYTPSWHIISAGEKLNSLLSMESIPKKPFVHNVIKYSPDGFETIRSAYELPKQAFACQGVKNLWVVGPCAAVPRDVAGWLSRPVNAMALGEMMGEFVANNLQNTQLATDYQISSPKGTASYCGEVKELLYPLRPNLDKGYVKTNQSILPVLGQYDVVVMGGGTAGAPAGISAAMHNAKTLVLDYLHGLGGIATLGFIGCYWDGFREGYTAEIDKAVRNMAPADHPRQIKSDAKFRADWKIEWYRQQLRKHKAELWYGVIGCGALVHKGKVEGLIVTTPFGRGVILSNIVIDSTGSADIAIAAGADYEYTGKKTLAVQGAGLSRFEPNDYYNNTDWTLIDDTDILDVSRLYVQGKAKYKGFYDLGKLPQTRERRRIIGDYTVTVYDVINHKRYPDTISYHKSSFDTHGMTIDPFFTLNPPGKRHVIYDADVPLRSLLPRGLEGIIVTGLGASAHRDAMPVIRMQPCLQNQGYSVGYLAALAAIDKQSLRKINIRKIQKHLVEKGILPARVLTDKETKTYSDKEFEVAARQVVEERYKGLEILLTDPARCIRIVRKNISGASGDARLIYASILCILGNKEFAPVVADAIKAYDVWDEGWHYTASAQFGECMSPLDSLIIALGSTGDASVLPVILEKANQLKLEDHFSHYRAICMACEKIKSPEATPVLARLLTIEGMRYNDIPSYRIAQTRIVPYVHDISYRNRILKELHLAKSLYLCGDNNKLGENTLSRYACGLEGHYARFAREILTNKY
ncbi:FAD-dependent oxidoreductase [Parabacteroides provencensis]|uniref:FAD-dependent oxidoreductase n=1 Tax=Parabacteroides provencensis TaxID=1944636 RepID=UPI000C1597EA|nr:FAD-dependent oxidoreductase [Parabacteroides provencensis]